MDNNKKEYIEVLRIIATMAVVMIHICMTEVVNSSINEIGKMNYAVYTVGYDMVRWAVPIFIMITGYLLLQPNKDISINKIMKYIQRIVISLLFFGMIYAIMEIVFEQGLAGGVYLIPKAFFRVLQMKSWDHLWYLYFLIGLYILTPFTKAAIRQIEEKELRYLIIFLSVINFVIPTINTVTGLNITKFYIAANGYFMYYLLGYYITIKQNLITKNKRMIYTIGLSVFVIMCIWDTYKILQFGTYSNWLRNSNCLVPIVVVAVFLFFLDKNKIEVSKNKAAVSISKCSFGIYLLHPFFINLIFKMFHFTPTSIPIIAGIIILFIVVFLLSWITTIIMKKIPFIKELV